MTQPEPVPLEQAIAALRQAANPADAAPMAAYMKQIAPFLGVKQPARRAATKAYLNAARRSSPAPGQVTAAMDRLYTLPEREFIYLAVDLFAATWRGFNRVAIVDQILPLIDRRPWWDSVDALRKPLSDWVKHDQATELEPMAQRLLTGSLWQRRVAITLQLGWKQATNLTVLDRVIQANRADPEFFIQKAIGWALRDYAWWDMTWVRRYVTDNGLTGLARREALKHLV